MFFSLGYTTKFAIKALTLLSVTSIFCGVLFAHQAKADTPLLSLPIINSAPHNSRSFIQGWVKDGDTFYESSGLYHRSYVTRYDSVNQEGTGKVRLKNKRTRNLDSHYFAEGLTLFNNKLYLLTWKENTLFVLNKHTLEIEQTLPYDGQGWGLSHDNTYLIMSDGSHQLTFRHANDFSIARTLSIKGLNKINELEYVDGIIWANQWLNDHMYAIDASTGCILAKVDLSGLRENTVKPDSKNVLNGIAYDKARHGLWVTGKYWPTRFLLALPESLSLLPDNKTGATQPPNNDLCL